MDTTIHARSVWLSAPNEGLTAKMDLIEGSGNHVILVEAEDWHAVNAWIESKYQELTGGVEGDLLTSTRQRFQLIFPLRPCR